MPPNLARPQKVTRENIIDSQGGAVWVKAAHLNSREANKCRIGNSRERAPCPRYSSVSKSSEKMGA